jgi:hypothetical protein
MRRVLILGALFAVFLLGLVLMGPPPPDATWDHSPYTVVVEMDRTGAIYISDNHIPLFRLWGDGTVLWVRDSDFRQVFRGTLTDSQIRALINDIIGIGFFHPRLDLAVFSCNSSEPAVTSTTLDLRLLDRSKLRQYADRDLEGCAAYTAERDLLAHLADGAGADPREYVPDGGQLFAFPATEAGCTGTPSSVPQWSSARYGFSLASVAAQDRWIDGDAIGPVWRAIAADEFCALIREGDTLYAVWLTIPGVTVDSPDGPAPR